MTGMKGLMLTILPVTLFGLILAGCGEPAAEPAKDLKPGDVKQPLGGNTAIPGGTDSKMGDAKSDPHSPPPSDGKSVDLSALEKAQSEADAAFQKAPADEKVKKAYVEATVKLATETMLSPDLAPREKYSKALKFYRLALKADPKNAEALENSKMIEDIYKQMGRPVPQ